MDTQTVVWIVVAIVVSFFIQPSLSWSIPQFADRFGVRGRRFSPAGGAGDYRKKTADEPTRPEDARIGMAQLAAPS